MMTQTLDDRLDVVVQRRNDLQAKKQRIEGRLEAARSSLAEVEGECRAKGVEPAELDATIEKLTTHYTTLIEKLEQQVEQATAALAPFLKES